MTAEFTGRVVRETWAAGSKSEHDAVMLDAGDERFRLRRLGASPFVDPVLDELVGHEVTVEGFVHNGVLFVDRVQRADEEGPPVG